MKSNMDVPKWIVFISWLLLQFVYLITGRWRMLARWEWHDEEDNQEDQTVY